jgi:SAM-dependent methyltransferase
MSKPVDPESIRSAVRKRYGAIASTVTQAATAEPKRPLVEQRACCAPAPTTSAGSGCGPEKDSISRNLYGLDDVADLPSAALLASLGCGNPTALAELRPGEVVLDLGSGGGIDVLLSARRVGPAGFAYGLDMTGEMLALAERNAAERGVTNVRFLKGQIEAIPLPHKSVDVITSNCVINLSADKARVLHEAFRVLKPGGRLAVSDIVVQGTLPSAVRESLELWAGCVAGALEEETYRRLLAEAGFAQIGFEVTRVYDAPAACADGRDTPAGAQAVPFKAMESTGGRLVSAFIRATKPTD